MQLYSKDKERELPVGDVATLLTLAEVISHLYSGKGDFNDSCFNSIYPKRVGQNDFNKADLQVFLFNISIRMDKTVV